MISTLILLTVGLVAAVMVTGLVAGLVIALRGNNGSKRSPGVIE